MPAPARAHLLRDRANSFGAIATDYDRYRPGYPDALLDELAALAGALPVLDLGTGTGKAAAGLVARGCDVLGVEPDAQMAAVAREHGLSVEVAGFESWDAAGRTFGLITAAQAWHWVDPAAGARKVCTLLRAGGTFAPFWNFADVDPERQTVADAVYLRLAPQLAEVNSGGQNQPWDRSYIEDLQAHGSFDDVRARTFRWEAELPVEHWVHRVATHSDHLMLDPDVLTRLRAELIAALVAQGPTVRLTGGTYLIRAHLAG